MNGKKISRSSGSSVDWVEEESYFFKLSAWGEKLLRIIIKLMPRFYIFLHQEK